MTHKSARDLLLSTLTPALVGSFLGADEDFWDWLESASTLAVVIHAIKIAQRRQENEKI